MKALGECLCYARVAVLRTCHICWDLWCLTLPGFRGCKTCVVICITANLADSKPYNHLRGVSLRKFPCSCWEDVRFCEAGRGGFCHRG